MSDFFSSQGRKGASEEEKASHLEAYREGAKAWYWEKDGAGASEHMSGSFVDQYYSWEWLSKM